MQQNGGREMNSVQRTRGIRRMIRVFVFRKPVQKYFTTGDRACGRMMREARSRRLKPHPGDSAILAWARLDLAEEIRSGFWEREAAVFPCNPGMKEAA